MTLTGPCAVGFTGSQEGMTAPQQQRVRHLLRLFNWTAFHHGDCIGADAEAHDIAEALRLKVVIHPPNVDDKRAWKFSAHMRAPAPYLARNKRIVEATHYMIAAPGQATEKLRSGTWATVRHARKCRRWIWLVLPDGAIA